ncbi:MAG TPA: sulfatase-like hydrolase/transferase, partial [Acidimicrobiales bacterium]
QIVVFGLLVALVPSLVAVAGSTVAWLAHPRLGAFVHGGALAGFAFLFGLVVADHLGVGAWWLTLAGAAALAALVVWLHRTRGVARSLLSYLAVGNVAFLLMFLFASPTAEVVNDRGDERVEGATQSSLGGPVVLIILDEFPVTTLLRGDGTINDDRYPNFARLAGESTWFRNAASHASMTSVAVPAILAGTLPGKGALPTYHDYPHNYLTLFGDRYPVNRYESVTDMCPPSVCEPPPTGSLRGALRDGAIVYGHQVLPDGMADGLPAIDHSWGGFGDEMEASAAPAPAEGSTAATPESVVGKDGYDRWHNLDAFDRSALGQSMIMGQAMSQVGTGPSVNLVHIALPHYPWTLTPWGVRLTKFPNELVEDPDDPGYALAAIQKYQLHALQVGAADAAVGDMIDQLQAAGAWDDALVVVTSDHGTSLTPPDLGRKITETNREEVLRMPLFIKAPGQTTGEVRDDPAQTIDVLPSVVDLLDAEVDWRFDGHSLYDGSEPRTERKVDAGVEPAFAIAAHHATDFAGEGWEGLAATGPHRDVIGTPVADLPVAEASELRWSADDEALFGSLPTEDRRVPYMLTGLVDAPGGERPPDLVVAVNGTVAGALGAYIEDGGAWRYTGVVGPWYVDGANTVDAYEVESTPAGPVLHPVGHR